jgi:hypothetical protein
MAPPVRYSQSCGGEPAVCPRADAPEVLLSSEMIAPSGISAPSAAQTASAVSAPVGSPGVDRQDATQFAPKVAVLETGPTYVQPQAN